MASVLEFVYLCVPVPNNVAVAGHDHKEIPRNIKKTKDDESLRMLFLVSIFHIDP